MPFFLRYGIAGAEDITRLNCLYIAAGRYTKAGPQFFYDLPLEEALRFVRDASQTAKEERREAERLRRRR